MFLSLFTGGLIARPVGKVFAEFGEDTSSDRLIGRNGTVSSATIPIEKQGRIGQVDVIDKSGNLVTINANVPEWAKVIQRHGETVIVIDRTVDVYLSIAANSPDENHRLRVTNKK